MVPDPLHCRACAAKHPRQQILNQYHESMLGTGVCGSQKRHDMAMTAGISPSAARVELGSELREARKHHRSRAASVKPQITAVSQSWHRRSITRKSAGIS